MSNSVQMFGGPRLAVLSAALLSQFSGDMARLKRDAAGFREPAKCKGRSGDKLRRRASEGRLGLTGRGY